MSFRWSEEQLVALARFLADRGLCRGPVRVEAIGDGHSNLTYRVSDGRNTVVLRRPPPPPLPPGAHDVLREARVIAALTGSGVPVPEVLATSESDGVLDVPFFVMSYVRGPVMTTEPPAALGTPATRGRLADDVIDTLAALHAVDWSAAGLHGRPEGSNLRHHRRYAALVGDPDGRLPEQFAEVDSWLVAQAPAETGEALVHNDFRLGNLILDPDRPGRVAAVLDWELAAVGDPLSDLGYLLASWPEPGRGRTPIEEFAVAVLAGGFPDRAALAQRYADRTGRDLGSLRWHVANAYFRLAVLYEYSRRRTETGVGDDYYAGPEKVAAFLVAAGAVAGLGS